MNQEHNYNVSDKEDYLRNINRLIQNGHPVLRGFKKYINKSVASSSLVNYIKVINRFLVFSDVELQCLDYHHCENFFETFERCGSSYNQQIYAALNHFGKFLVREGYQTDNIMDSILRAKTEKTSEQEERRSNGVLDKKGIRIYLTSVKNGYGSARAKARQKPWLKRDFAMIMVMLNTGVRRDTVSKLNYSHFNKDKETLVLTEKGGKTRTIKISKELCEIIQEWVDDREEKLGEIKEPALFISNERTRITGSSIYRVVKKYSIAIGYEGLTPHKLRATYATQNYLAGKDLLFVQELLNHESIETTRKYIRNLNQDAHIKAAYNMGKATGLIK